MLGLILRNTEYFTQAQVTDNDRYLKMFSRVHAENQKNGILMILRERMSFTSRFNFDDNPNFFWTTLLSVF